MERHLRAAADHQAVVFVPIGDDDVRLDVRLLHLGHAVLALEDVVGFGKALLHVADVDADVRRQVAAGVGAGKIDVFRLVVQDRRPGLHRLRRIEQGRQRLVLDLDQLERLLGDLLALGGHESHPVANEAHASVQREGIQRTRDGVGLPGGGIDHARDVLPGEHRGHAGQAPGRRWRRCA